LADRKSNVRFEFGFDDERTFVSSYRVIDELPEVLRAFTQKIFMHEHSLHVENPHQFDFYHLTLNARNEDKSAARSRKMVDVDFLI
jgi:hypothetical protein